MAIWKDFKPELIDRELGYAQRLGLNAVRMFLQYVVYEADPKLFLERLDRFVEIADKRGLQSMIVLFDSCFGEEPALEKADSKMWVNNPGFSRIAAPGWSRLENYASDVVKRFSGDRRILAWDIMNEPEADFNHVTRAERDQIWKFVRHFCRYVKETDPTHPITVGHAVVEYIPKTMDLVDVLSIHSYFPYEAWFQNDLDTAMGYGVQAGKPVIITEFGNPSVGQKYEAALDTIDRNRLGFFLWELMIGKIMFNNVQGLFYPDGSVRDLAPIARLLGFRVNPDGIPLKPSPPEAAEIKALVDDPARWAKALEEAEKAPRTREGVQPHLLRLGTLARFRLRPSAEAGEMFEMGLTIPHLFRLKRSEEAVATYEEMLRLARKAIQR